MGPPGTAEGSFPQAVTGTACKWKLVKSLPTMHALGFMGSRWRCGILRPYSRRRTARRYVAIRIGGWGTV